MKDVIITDGNVEIKAKLNDTVAAKDFETRLPFKCSGFDSGVDYCCSAKEGKFDPNEQQVGWKNGDISLGGGWFALLYDGEENSDSYKDMMIIGHINEDDLALVKELPRQVDFTVIEAE